MGRAPCCDKANVKKGPWSPEEDSKLKEYIEKYGTGGNWIALPQKAGLKRCGKSCRLRWLNYLRPNIKHGEFTDEEDRMICSLFANIGSRWSIIAAQLPGRTDNDIKNYWNTKLKKKLMALAPPQRKPPPFPSSHHQTTTTLPFPSHHQSSLFSLNKSFTCFDSFDQQPISASHLLNNNSNTSMATANSTQFQIQEGQLVGNSIQFYNNNPMKENFLMFGSDQTSCSSSDGSCGQISYGNKEIKQEDQMGFQGGYNYSNGFEENHKFMLSYGSNNSNSTSTGGDQNQIYSWAAEKTNGFFGEPPTPPSHYSTLEDVKQLISSSCVNGYHHDTDNNDNNNFFTDANKYCYYYNY
ncbi:hypothetical protein ACOSQ4_016402 [Xanthoceras sorbifolium]